MALWPPCSVPGLDTTPLLVWPSTPMSLSTLNSTTYCNGRSRMGGKERWFFASDNLNLNRSLPLAGFTIVHSFQVAQRDFATPCCSSYRCCGHSWLFSFSHTLHLLHQQVTLALLPKYFRVRPLLWTSTATPGAKPPFSLVWIFAGASLLVFLPQPVLSTASGVMLLHCRISLLCSKLFCDFLTHSEVYKDKGLTCFPVSLLFSPHLVLPFPSSLFLRGSSHMPRTTQPCALSLLLFTLGTLFPRYPHSSEKCSRTKNFMKICW